MPLMSLSLSLPPNPLNEGQYRPQLHFSYLNIEIIYLSHLVFVIIIWMQGYNGSQLWDTAFAVQAIISTNIAEEYGPTLKKAHEYIKDSQVPFVEIFLYLEN